MSRRQQDISPVSAHKRPPLPTPRTLQPVESVEEASHAAMSKMLPTMPALGEARCCFSSREVADTESAELRDEMQKMKGLASSMLDEVVRLRIEKEQLLATCEELHQKNEELHQDMEEHDIDAVERHYKQLEQHRMLLSRLQENSDSGSCPQSLLVTEVELEELEETSAASSQDKPWRPREQLSLKQAEAPACCGSPAQAVAKQSQRVMCPVEEARKAPSGPSSPSLKVTQEGGGRQRLFTTPVALCPSSPDSAESYVIGSPRQHLAQGPRLPRFEGEA